MLILPTIKRHELRKFTAMALMMFCILFNYSAIYSLRDSLIMPELGAEALSFLEFWIVLPCAFVFTLLYIKLTTVIKNQEIIFYLITSVFLLFFLAFAFILYPYQHLIEPAPALIKRLVIELPHYKWFILLYGKWPYVLFNLFAELWVNIMLSLFFWQLADQICATEEAKRFYPMLGFIGNIALICSGTVLKTLSIWHHNLIIQPIAIAITISGMIIILLYRFIHAYIISNQDQVANIKPKSTKPHLTFRESLKVILSSRYLWLLATLVICYGLTINISQGIWKSQVAKFCPTTEEYVLFMADYQKWMGIVAIIFMLIDSFIVANCSWLATTIITPIIAGIAGIMFYTLVSFSWLFYNLAQAEDLLYLTVMIGMIQIILSKAAKFSLFDATKEMAFIPLPPTLLIQGKAAVDVLGERFGKSFGAFLQTVIFSLFPTASYNSIAPYLFIVFILIIMVWLWVTKALSAEYNKYIKGN